MDIRIHIWIVILTAFSSVDRVKVSAQDEAITIDPHWEENENGNNGPVNTVVLQSPIVTDWGRWGRFVHCSMKHSYVTGFQLRVETKQSGTDNTAVNGISLSCGIPEQKEIERIRSARGPWGTGRTRMFCAKGPAVGFQLKVQKPQGREIDDVATINVKMICGNGQILEGFDEQGDYYVDTVWSEPMICPNDMAVCGMQTQVEPRRWLGDDTALNNIRIRCCPLPIEGQQEENYPPTESTTTTQTVDMADQAATTKLTVFKSQDGSGESETLQITDGRCNNLPLQWQKQVGSFTKDTSCVRLWEGFDCSGHNRCYCDDNFLSLNGSYTMSKESSWYQQLTAVGPCQLDENSEDKYTEALLFSRIRYEGERTRIVLAPGECVTFYEGDHWHKRTTSVFVNRGCIQLFDGEECTGESTKVESTFRYVGHDWANRTVAIRNCVNDNRFGK